MALISFKVLKIELIQTKAIFFFFFFTSSRYPFTTFVKLK